MHIKIDKNQGSATSRSPHTRRDAGKFERAKAVPEKANSTKAGSLAGESLRFSYKDYVDSLPTGGQQSFKPVLPKPKGQPDIATHQSVLSDMDRIVNEGDDKKLLMEQLKQAKADGESFTLGGHELSTMNHFFMLMALFHQMGVEQRQLSRRGWSMANMALVSKIRQQAQQQRLSASARLNAGLIGGFAKVAAGTMSLIGLKRGIDAYAAAAPDTKPGDHIIQWWSAWGKITESGGEVGTSVANYYASGYDAVSSELRAEEERIRSVKQSEQDQIQIANELLNKARDAYSQTVNQYVQTQSGIIRNI